MSDTQEVLTEVDNGVLVVTINRPEAKNAMTKAAAEGIAAAMDRLDSVDDLRVGILTGAGGTFCSGMDLKGFLRGETPSVEGRGFGGVVPKGFPVAVVTRVVPASDGLSLQVEAESPVNFLALEEVFVMTDEVPWDQAIFYNEADTMMMRDILRGAP